MKVIRILIAGIVLFTFISCGKSSGDPSSKVGKPCTADNDCGGGLCIDLSTYDDGCIGVVCTIPCSRDSDCPTKFKERDCDPTPGVEGKVCMYGEWQSKLCK